MLEEEVVSDVEEVVAALGDGSDDDFVMIEIAVGTPGVNASGTASAAHATGVWSNFDDYVAGTECC